MAQAAQAEADSRIFCNDLAHGDRDEDCRMYAALPPEALKRKALGAARVDSCGRAAVELVVGADFDRSEANVVWVLVHKGHMRPPVAPSSDALAALYGAGVGIQELPALGWEALLEPALSTRSPPARPGSPACQRRSRDGQLQAFSRAF